MNRVKMKSSIGAFIRVTTGFQWIKERNLKGPIILVYHGIVDKITDPVLEQYCIDVKTFSKHISFLKNRYILVPLFEMINELKTVKKTPHDWISITLDDALQNQKKIAQQRANPSS